MVIQGRWSNLFHCPVWRHPCYTWYESVWKLSVGNLDGLDFLDWVCNHKHKIPIIPFITSKDKKTKCINSGSNNKNMGLRNLNPHWI